MSGPVRQVPEQLGEHFEQMLDAAQSGGGWAAERIWTWLAPAVAGYLRVQGAEDPDDLTSEVFLGVFRSLGSFSGGEEQFRSWVFTIAHRRRRIDTWGAGRGVDGAGVATGLDGLEGELRRVMEKFENFPLKAYMATHPTRVDQPISDSILGEKAFKVVNKADRGEPGRYDRVLNVIARGGKSIEVQSTSTTQCSWNDWRLCSTEWRNG